MALARLEEALAAYDETPTTVVRDGVIQRFEFCTELAWKAAREYLLDQGHVRDQQPQKHAAAGLCRRHGDRPSRVAETVG